MATFGDPTFGSNDLNYNSVDLTQSPSQSPAQQYSWQTASPSFPMPTSDYQGIATPSASTPTKSNLTSGGFNPMMGVYSLGKGLYDSYKAKKAIAAARALRPATTDPIEQQRTTDLKNMRDQISTGVAYQEPLRQINQSTANTLQNIYNNSGGYVGSAIAGAALANQSAGNAIGNLAAQSQGQRMAYDQMLGANMGKQAQRAYDLQNSAYAQAMADALGQKQLGQQETQNAFSMLMPSPKDIASFASLLA